MDCQKARKIQHRRGMAKRGTSLDPEVRKSSRPLLPASHLHPKKAFEIAENLGILQKKSLDLKKHCIPKKKSKNVSKIIILCSSKMFPRTLYQKKKLLYHKKSARKVRVGK